MVNGKIRPLAIANPRPLNRSIKKIETGEYVRETTPCAKFREKFVYWGLVGKKVKYNGFFHIGPTFFNDRPTGQTDRRIFTRNGSNDAVSRKGVPF